MSLILAAIIDANRMISLTQAETLTSSWSDPLRNLDFGYLISNLSVPTIEEKAAKFSFKTAEQSSTTMEIMHHDDY